MTDNLLFDALRKPFPANKIHKLEKAGIALSYVSHADVTERLLDVDPNWTWEPVAFGPDGLPALDANGGLWIRLTVLGVTRYGYGEPQGRDEWDKVKGAIGNAIRVAAMRFGVALELWQKDGPPPTAEAPKWENKYPPNSNNGSRPATDKQVTAVIAVMKKRGIEPEYWPTALSALTGRNVTTPDGLFMGEVDLFLKDGGSRLMASYLATMGIEVVSTPATTTKQGDIPNDNLWEWPAE